MRRVTPRRFIAAASAVVGLLLLPIGIVAGLETARAADSLRFEAEDGELSGVAVGNSVEGYSGGGYVESIDEDADSVTITIPDSPGGLYDLSVLFAAPYGDKKAPLQLNGEGLGEVSFAETTTFSSVSAGKVLLRPGDNTVTILRGWGWFLLDAIEVTPAADRAPHQVSGELVNPDANAETKSLSRYLTANYGKQILSGQQEWESIQWVEENVGQSPAVAGLDMIDYSPSRVERGATAQAQDVEHAIEWDSRGGIVTFAWHWNAPSGLIDEEGKEWWRGFYTDATTFDVEAALANKDSEDYGLLIRDIDAIAVQLGRLQDAGVPVLWRPLHEAEGGWFWWGAKGPGPAKELYRIMYDRLTNHHHLNNLIWVWNSVNPEWYPGDDVVDIVSTDSYPPNGDHGAVSATYEKLVELGQDKKLVALTENGSIPDPDLLQAYQADWSWFVTWAGQFIKDGVTNPLDFVKQVYNHPYVVNLDEIGDFKHFGEDPTETTTTTTDSTAEETTTTEDSTTEETTTTEDSTTEATTTEDSTTEEETTTQEETTSEDPVDSGVVADYAVLSQWPGGFVAAITVTNRGSEAVSGWSAQWEFAEGQGIANSWSSQVSIDGRVVTAGNMPWNGTIAPGASVTFGFVGTFTSSNPVPTITVTSS